MFTQLVASRPRMDREKPGMLFSLLLHGSLVAAAVLLTAPKPDLFRAQSEPRQVLLPPVALPHPEPAPPSPMPFQRAPRAPAPALPVITPDIPTTVPVPSPQPWSPPTGTTMSGDPSLGGGVPDGSGGGTPLPGPSGAFGLEQVDVAVALDPRSPLPRYPDGLRAWRSEGIARLRFIVDTLGRVEPRSVEVIESSHPAFAASVRSTLPRMRFRPARIGARPVRQLVEFPITFRLDP